MSLLLSHPVAAVFEHLTSILSHMLSTTSATNEPCSCCLRPASDFGYQSHKGCDSFGSYSHCSACESFKVTDLAIMGIERNRKEMPDGTITGVGHKFGMMSGSGCVISHKGHVVFFTPPGTYEKLPAEFLERVHVIPCTTGQHLEKINTFLQSTPDAFPLVYIRDFGKKKHPLIRGLRWSPSASQLIFCSDDGNTSFTESLNTVDLNAVEAISQLKSTLTTSQWAEFKKLVNRLSNGIDSPETFSESMKRSPAEYLQIYRLLPKEPHQRTFLLSLIK